MNCPVYPPHAACGGHGTCDTTKGLCACEDGWTSRGDFFMSKGVNCNINLTAIKVLWGLTMVFNVLVIREAFLFLKVRMWDTPFKRKYLSDPTFQFPLFYFVGCVIGVGMAILKIVDPEERSIGYDPLATVFFCGMCFFVVSATFIFALVLIRVIIGQTKMMAPENKARVKKYGEKVRYTVLICIASCLVLCNIPLLILAFPKQEYVISSLFYAGQCSSAIFLLVLIYLSLSMIVGEITKHLNNKIPDSKEKGENPMAEVRNKLLKGKQVLISMGPGILLTYLAIIFSEFLYMNSSYIWPLFFLLSQPSLYAYIHSVRLRGPTPTDSYDDSRSKTGQINTSKLEGETSKTPSKITDNGVITDQEEKAMASSKIVAFTPPKDKADNI